MKRATMAMFLLGTAISTAHAVPISGQGTWETTLQGRDLDGNAATFEAYYDTTLDVTWLADANYAGATMSDLAAAKAWAAGLNPYGSGITGWRLPTTVDVDNDGATYSNYYQGVDYGFNITTHSEMSHMFYRTLGNTAFYDTSGMVIGCSLPDFCPNYNTGPFDNLQPDLYWSAAEYPPGSTEYAWFFDMFYGSQNNNQAVVPFDLYAWAVRSGDVGISQVPIPASVWLFGGGLFAMVGLGVRRRR